MSRVLASTLAAPAAALVLGVGGLIPLVGLAALGVIAPGTLHFFPLTTLAQYGAVILAFVGALQWGYAVAGRVAGAAGWVRYGWSVVPALVGWMSLQFPIESGLRLQAGALIVSVAVDRAFAAGSSLPDWLMPLRYLLTGVAATSLLVASFT